MKCPRCGHEMADDNHRKIPLQMCYECGYIEGRNIDDGYVPETVKENNFQHMKKLNFNEQIAFLSEGLGIDDDKLFEFLDAPYNA